MLLKPWCLAKEQYRCVIEGAKVVEVTASAFTAADVQVPKHEGVKYRPDIDGLRALAILPVLWFHSDLPGLPGGFTGVDTFFVISGYLITLIIHRDIVAGRFSFAGFYERRIRRIAPALLLVISVSTLVAYLLLLPYELEQYARSDVAALAMVSNVYFWMTADYFALADRIIPLLHSWSLGVEEQFYVLFPPALLIAERFRKTKATVAVLLLGSLALSLFFTPHSPAAAFYLLPTRGWELMAGASLAIGLFSIPEKLKGISAALGVVLLVIAAVWITANDGIPGWHSAIPVGGAALLIGAGPSTATARFLSTRPLVAIGRISYSLYLWHWPIFVFLREYWGVGRLPAATSIAGIVASFALAALTFQYVETPARQRSLAYRKVFVACIAVLGVNLAAAAIAWTANGLPGRLPAKVASIAAFHDLQAPLARKCNHGIDVAHCHLGPPGDPQFALFGDSQGSALSEAVATGLSRPGIVVALGGCPPAIGWVGPTLKGNDRRDCQRFNPAALKVIAGSRSISLVVLSARWPFYDASDRMKFWPAVQAVIDELNRAGKRVVVITGIPDPGIDIPWTSAIRARFGRPPLRLGCDRPYMPLRDVTVVDVSAAFCDRLANGLFTDNVHISRDAALDIVTPRIAALAQAKGSSDPVKGRTGDPATCPSSRQPCLPVQPAR